MQKQSASHTHSSTSSVIQRKQAIADARQLIELYGLTLEEIFPPEQQRDALKKIRKLMLEHGITVADLK